MESNDWDEKPKNKQKNDNPEGDNWRNLPATPQRLATLFSRKFLPESAWRPAQKFSGLIPKGDDWLRFVDLLMVSMGTIFLLVGIVMFFAFNWDDLSKWNRFAIVQGAVIISTILAFVFNLDKWSGRLTLGASSILLGVALAVTSQEYQTGADSYRLFLVWLMLITGWVLISRWNIMYLIWMVLLNITIGFYWEQVINTDWHTFNLIILTINAAFVFLWDGIALGTRFKFMTEGRWFLYIFIVIALSHGTTLVADYIFDAGWSVTRTILHPIAYFSLLAGIVGFYRFIRRDLLMLTFASLSFLVVAVMWSGYIILDAFGDSIDIGFFIFYFIVMAAITIGLTVTLVTQLRRLNQRWEVNND